MTLEEAIRQRHSVRAYTPRPIDADAAAQLRQRAEELNGAFGLHIQLVQDRPEAFESFLAHYGGMKNVRNYLALVGPDDETLDEKCGWCGEQLVLLAEQLGLSTCWVGGTFSKKKAAYAAAAGEKLCVVIAVGYAAAAGKPHRSKKAADVSRAPENAPAWFARGVELALLAPTAINQQKFVFELVGENGVRAAAGKGPFARVDLGIVKYHFAVGAGEENFRWV